MSNLTHNAEFWICLGGTSFASVTERGRMIFVTEKRKAMRSEGITFATVRADYRLLNQGM
jgi:hypothetical protein